MQANVLRPKHVESTVRNTPHAEYHRFIAPSVQSDIETITHVLAALATVSVENHVRVRPGAPVLSIPVVRRLHGAPAVPEPW